MFPLENVYSRFSRISDSSQSRLEPCGRVGEPQMLTLRVSSDHRDLESPCESRLGICLLFHFCYVGLVKTRFFTIFTSCSLPFFQNSRLLTLQYQVVLIQSVPNFKNTRIWTERVLNQSSLFLPPWSSARPPSCCLVFPPASSLEAIASFPPQYLPL